MRSTEQASGYSGTPLPRKLGIRAGARVALLGAPADFALELPDGAALVEPEPPLDVVVVFVRTQAELSREFGPVVSMLRPEGGLRVAWPKRSSGVASDLDENRVRELGLRSGLVDNKVCAISEIWSGLRFVRRLRDR
ncbi:MAG: DUF3052 domain-containing protein [Gaiellaceae bacterium]